MEKHKLSHQELVKLGLHESSRGHSLGKIEAEFHRLGIGRNDSIKALKTIDYMNKREERKKSQESHAKSGNKGEHAKEPAGKNKSSFLFWVLVLLILLGIGYLFYEGMLSLEAFGINFK